MPKKIYKLCVSYDEAGAELRQHLADRIKLLGMDGAPVWQASFRATGWFRFIQSSCRAAGR